MRSKRLKSGVSALVLLVAVDVGGEVKDRCSEASFERWQRGTDSSFELLTPDFAP